jgi:hypothetical protein
MQAMHKYSKVMFGLSLLLTWVITSKNGSSDCDTNSEHSTKGHTEANTSIVTDVKATANQQSHAKKSIPNHLDFVSLSPKHILERLCFTPPTCLYWRNEQQTAPTTWQLVPRMDLTSMEPGVASHQKNTRFTSLKWNLVDQSKSMSDSTHNNLGDGTTNDHLQCWLSQLMPSLFW